MRILYLCQRIPFAPNRGDRIIVFHQIRHLMRSHEVIVGSLSDDSSGRDIKAFNDNFECRLLAPRQSKLRQLTEMTRCLLKGEPLSLGYFRNRRLTSMISSCHKKTPLDAAIVFSSSMAQYVEKISEIPRIMHFCDLDSQKWRGMAQHAIALKRWIYARESRVLLEYERKIAAEFNASCVVSDQEAALFQKYIPRIPVQVLENGIDVDYFTAVPRQPKGLNIVFVGVMDYPPNAEAVTFFAEHVWNTIRATYPQARFQIVGSRPPRGVRNLARIPGVECTGHVPDVRSYLAGARLAIAPLAISRGIQNKILEAMVAGTPVLTTPDVARGIPEGAAPHISVAKREPEAFASAVLGILKNQTAAEEKAAAAKSFVIQNCSWETKLRALDNLIKKAVLKYDAVD
jgi:polysaccharide biosynthesis protein PslH